MMEYEIALKDLRFHARHGVMEQESKVGNEFIVNLRVRIPYATAIAGDNLQATVSYADLFAIVKAEMERPRKLLESVAASIQKQVMARWPKISAGSISISKSIPPIAPISGSSEIVLFF